jgi:hypothetical protein
LLATNKKYIFEETNKQTRGNMNVIKIDFRELKNRQTVDISVHENDNLVVACLAKAIIEDAEFRVLLDDTLRFILEDIGEDNALRKIKKLLDELNIQING